MMEMMQTQTMAILITQSGVVHDTGISPPGMIAWA
jgi:hypothetical protein